MVPELSVVMSVYNGERDLRASMESILTQYGLELEFVVVNDGSTDGSAVIIDQYARTDSRVVAVHQENHGLTRALIRGCAEARSEFVARQDCGDVSLPERLASQLRAIRSSEDIHFVSCGTRFVGPSGEHLFDVVGNSVRDREAMLSLDPEELAGPPCHPCMVFRKSAYERVGGYRVQFEIAQDIDLWVRLAEQGGYGAVPAILYECKYSLDGISSRRALVQKELLSAITSAAALRRRGLADSAVLAKVADVTRKARLEDRPNGQAGYFLAATLLKRNPEAARRYLLQSLKERPLNYKAWLRVVQSWFYR